MSSFTPGQRVVVISLAMLLALGLLGQAYETGRRAVVPELETFVQPSPVPAEAAPEPFLKVHIAGAVHKPGVYVFSPRDRVMDAIERAGGSLPGARLDDLNLAGKLTDGIRLYIPGPTDGPRDEVIVVTEDIYIHAPPPPRPLNAPPTPTTPRERWIGPITMQSGAPHSDRKELPFEPVNVNTASLEELMKLPGVGEVTARRILAYRATRGKFGSPRELLEVQGIGEKTFTKMEPYVVVK